MSDAVILVRWRNSGNGPLCSRYAWFGFGFSSNVFQSPQIWIWISSTYIYIIYNMCMSINTMMYIFTNKTKPCNTWSQIESICFIAYISPVHFPKSFTSCLPILKSCHVSSNYPPPFHHDGGRIPWMMCKKKHQSTGTIQLTPDGSGESVATSDGKNHNKTTTTRNAREKNKGKKNKHEDTKKNTRNTETANTNNMFDSNVSIEPCIVNIWQVLYLVMQVTPIPCNQEWVVSVFRVKSCVKYNKSNHSGYDWIWLDNRTTS